jgi:AraC family transcriptional regulator, regulatory protein of adaptative response / methylated-DNA-[protein]-cysteine methyltransferase
MTQAQPTRPAPPFGQTDDYARIRRAIGFLTDYAHAHPNLDTLAEAMGLSPAHAQKLFKRWCGLSPKEFIQAIALDRAREMLDGSASLLETAHEIGLSGAGRLHDLFVSYEAMTPGDYKRRGAGLTLHYGFHACPFGTALAMVTERGLAGLAFVNEDAGETLADSLTDMQRRWPEATYVEDAARTGPAIASIFGAATQPPSKPVRLVLIGTDFDVRVWRTLLQIPMGRAVTYGDLARHLDIPRAARAVGSAVGRNPISFVVPCHRVLRSDGGLGGYHWGLTRKRALIGWETGRLQQRSAERRLETASAQSMQ